MDLYQSKPKLRGKNKKKSVCGTENRLARNTRAHTCRREHTLVCSVNSIPMDTSLVAAATTTIVTHESNLWHFRIQAVPIEFWEEVKITYRERDRTEERERKKKKNALREDRFAASRRRCTRQDIFAFRSKSCLRSCSWIMWRGRAINAFAAKYFFSFVYFF